METKIKKIKQDCISVITDFMRWYDKDFNFTHKIKCNEDTLTSMFWVSNEHIIFWGEDDVYSFKELPLDTLLAISEDIHKYILYKAV